MFIDMAWIPSIQFVCRRIKKPSILFAFVYWNGAANINATVFFDIFQILSRSYDIRFDHNGRYVVRHLTHPART